MTTRRAHTAALFYHLIKDKQNPNITQAMENAAMLRVPAHDRQELVMRAGGQLVDPDELQQELFGEKQYIGFMHSVMVQCFLPQKPLAADMRRFVSTHGKASLVVEAGILANPETPAESKECVVPYGSHTRLILPWINRYALQHKTREIDMGQSLREFMEKVGRPIGGYNGKKTTENIEAIGAAQFVLGEWSEQGATTKYGRVAQEVSFWIERDPNQHVLWTPSLVSLKRITTRYANGRCLSTSITLANSPSRQWLWICTHGLLIDCRVFAEAGLCAFLCDIYRRFSGAISATRTNLPRPSNAI